MKRPIDIFRPLLLAICLALVGAGHVQADDDHEQARNLREAGEILPLETIIAKVHASGLGRVLEVELKTEHGRYVYEIEVIDRQGRVMELLFDARSGQQLKSEREND